MKAPSFSFRSLSSKYMLGLFVEPRQSCTGIRIWKGGGGGRNVEELEVSCKNDKQTVLYLVKHNSIKYGVVFNAHS